MYCPKCGKENPDDAKSCSSCGVVLTPATEPVKQPIVKTSGLAIASFILGILSILSFSRLLLFVITPIPALILGIISLVRIEKSGGRLTGRGFAIVGIVVPVVVFFLWGGIIVLVLRNIRDTERRMTCGRNLAGIGKAMIDYSNDYNDEFPRAGGPNTKWGITANWQANNLSDAFGLKDGDGQATISASLYLLVKYEDVTPKCFVCKGDSGTREFKPTKYGIRDRELIEFWDFGPEPWKHCSYSYHMSYGPYALTTSNLPGMVVAADRNPWIESPAADAKIWANFQPDLLPIFTGTAKQARYGNAIAHQEDGQNVLFVDSHVDFERRPYCGIDDDNIYTHLPQGIGRPQLGEVPIPFISQPGHRKDSFLVHDPPGVGKKMKLSIVKGR